MTYGRATESLYTIAKITDIGNQILLRMPKTFLRTWFVDGKEERALIEGRPEWNMATLPDGSVVAIRSVDWPTDESWGDFDENGWLRP